MQEKKLLAAMAVAGHTPGSLSKAIGIDQSTFYRKIADGKPHFTIDEATKIKNLLAMDDETACQIFLN